jgi:F-type H+-transporting ATPase subunit b
LFVQATLALQGGSSLISPDGSLIIGFLLFLLFCLVMNRLLFKPIGHVLDQRTRLTDGARAEARAALRVHDAKLAEYESRLRQARAESYRFLEHERNLALKERGDLLEGAKRSAASAIEQAKDDLASQVVQARSALEGDAGRLAADISKAVLGRTVDGGAN